jgi:hypothetical protein
MHPPPLMHPPPPAHTPAAIAHGRAPAAPPRVATVAASKPTPAAKHTTDEGHANARSLGALDDMFKD